MPSGTLATTSSLVSMPLRALGGLRRAARTRRVTPRAGPVSMPLRALGGLRPGNRAEDNPRKHRAFQCPCGLWGDCDRTQASGSPAQPGSFQCPCGLWGDCDRQARKKREWETSCFNALAGFGGIATTHDFSAYIDVYEVSMPLRALGGLRPAPTAWAWLRRLTVSMPLRALGGLRPRGRRARHDRAHKFQCPCGLWGDCDSAKCRLEPVGGL